LVFIKSKDMSLLYNHNYPWIMSFNVKNLLVPAPPIKNKHIGVSKYNCFLCITSSNINIFSSFNCLNKLWYSSFSSSWNMMILWNFHVLKIVIFGLIHYVIKWQNQIINHCVQYWFFLL
jgi:hypothetical protein